jgi:hypothetical protein
MKRTRRLKASRQVLDLNRSVRHQLAAILEITMQVEGRLTTFTMHRSGPVAKRIRAVTTLSDINEPGTRHIDLDIAG